MTERDIFLSAKWLYEAERDIFIYIEKYVSPMLQYFAAERYFMPERYVFCYGIAIFFISQLEDVIFF